MSFFGRSFVFNSVPCEAYELMMYDLGSAGQGGGEFASTVTIEEEVVGNRQKPYFYGVKYDKKLELELVFGVHQRRIDAQKYLDRYEIDQIANWLTGHSQYHWLEVEQHDMQLVRYNCICTGLNIVSYGNIPWALQAVFECDGPYGYMDEREFVYTVNGSSTISFFNESCSSDYYRPNITIDQTGGTFSITNVTDGNRMFKLEDYPAAVQHVYVDNDHCVLTNDQDINLYPFFNYNFFRLKKGYNTLNVVGNGTLRIRCAFPINTGG